MLRTHNVKTLGTAAAAACAAAIAYCHAQTKGEQLFAFALVVGADGFEPPTYAL
jgi:hypothetical protein